MGKTVKVTPVSNADVTERYLRAIERKSGRAVRPYRTDGFVNLMNKYGTSKDTSEHYYFQPEPTVPDDVLSMFYEGNGLFAKIIDAPAEEALKKGFTLDGISDQSILDFAYESLDELDWEEMAMTSLKWARLFGGSIAVLLINDGRGLEEPLDWKSIKSIDDIRIYDRSVIQPDYNSMFSYDPTDPFGTRGSRLGMPEYYHITSRYGSFTVHDSRCLVFQNGILPENCTNSIYQLWGMPEYIRLRRAIKNTELAHESAPKMLDKSIQPIYKIKNLASILSTDDGEDAVLRRLQVIDLARGMLNSIAIDADGEDYDFKSFQFAGVSDIVDATCNYLSALTSIPQTILFGRSPAGMNSTGQSDMENYYNYVERIQKRMLRSNLRYLLSVIFQAGLYTHEVEEIPNIKIKFNSLWSSTEKEQIELEQQKAALQQTKAQTAQVYVDMGSIDPTEIRKKLADSEEFNVETILDDYSDDELFDNMPQQEEQQGQMTDMTAEAPNEADGVNSPDAAPEATKLPQDMDVSTHSDSSEMDGGPGSGNFGHEGVPGQIGGSAPSQGEPITDNEKRAIIAYTGNNQNLSKEQRAAIESAIIKSEPLDIETEYSRGIALTKKELDDLIESGTYSPQTLTSWSESDRVAEEFALDNSYGNNKFPVVLCYRGTKMLDKGMDVTELSQHPEEREAVFSSSIEMKIEKGEISGYDASDDEPTVTVYINLYDKKGNADGTECLYDGGPGSGNWEHEGVDGQFGGSAPGGGNHNRMTDKNGGYTSFSKEKKRFATPHKVTNDELDKCPDGSKVCFEQYGKRVTYEKNKDGTFTSNSGMTLSASEMTEKLSEQGKDAAIYTPDSVSPNYSIKRECYSNERKAAAPRTESTETVDSILRKNTEKVWANADEFTKNSLCNYTLNDYNIINSKLRDGTESEIESVKKRVDAITEAISESKLEKDMWLTRGVNENGAAAFLGISPDAIIGVEDFDVNSLVGKTVSDDAFMSCGSTYGTGMRNVANYSIYCPAGTEALYAEPFSELGMGDGRKWNGTDTQEYFSREFETILQRGTKCRITKVSRDVYGTLNIEMEVVSQKYKK